MRKQKIVYYTDPEGHKHRIIEQHPSYPDGFIDVVRADKTRAHIFRTEIKVVWSNPPPKAYNPGKVKQ